MTATDWPEVLVTEHEDTLLGEAGGSAWFNEAKTHRYLLTRTWADGPLMTWVMLNPSTADAFADDPTIRRCTGFARREGCGGIKVVNLYAVRSASPDAIGESQDPIGPCNDRFIDEHARDGLVVAGWGALGSLGGRGAEVGKRLAASGTRLLCVGLTSAGQPRHPLYVRAAAPLLPWEVPS